MFTLTTFKQHARDAIRKYEARFTEKKPMNAHRAQDVLALQYTLETDASSTIDILMQKLENYLQTIKTGWWIFKTGNSRLKDNLNEVFKAYKNPLLRCAHESLGHMSESYDALKETFDAIKRLHPEATTQLEPPKSSAMSIPVPISTLDSPRLWDSVREDRGCRLSFFIVPTDEGEEAQTQAGGTTPPVVITQSKSYF